MSCFQKKKSRWGRDFPCVHTGPGSHPISRTMGTGSFPGGKVRPGRDTDPSPPSCAMVKKEYSYTSTTAMGRTACTEAQCLQKGVLYLLPLLIRSSRQKMVEAGYCKSERRHIYIIAILIENLFFMARQPPVGHGLLIHEVSRSHATTHHSRQDSSGRVINSSQRPLPDNTQHSQQTDIHASSGIRTHSLSRRAAADPRLRPCGHWDWQQRSYKKIKFQIMIHFQMTLVCQRYEQTLEFSLGLHFSPQYQILYKYIQQFLRYNMYGDGPHFRRNSFHSLLAKNA